MKLLSTHSLKLTKNTGDTEQNNHTMDASKFQPVVVQLDKVRGKPNIEMFIKEANSYKLESYETQY